MALRIDFTALSADALRGVIESFVLREGTDYGRDYTLAQKCEAVLAQLHSGEAYLDFDPVAESVDIKSVADSPPVDFGE